MSPASGAWWRHKSNQLSNFVVDLLMLMNWLPVDDGKLRAPDVAAMNDDFLEITDRVVPRQSLVNPILRIRILSRTAYQHHFLSYFTLNHIMT